MSPAPATQAYVDFSGGFSDNLFGDLGTRCFYNDNFLLTTARKPLLRPGSAFIGQSAVFSSLLDPRVYRFSKTSSEDFLMASIQGGGIYTTTSALSSWTSQVAVDSQAYPFYNGTTSSISVGQWQDQFLFAPNQHTDKVIKAWYTGSAWKVATAGLPAPALTDNFVTATVLADAITLANTLRTAMINHFRDSALHKSLLNFTFTGNTTNASPTVTSIGSFTSGYSSTQLTKYAPLSGTGIPAGTTVSGVVGTTLTLSANATATASGVTITVGKGDTIAEALVGTAATSTLQQLLDLVNSLTKAFVSHHTDAKTVRQYHYFDPPEVYDFAFASQSDQELSATQTVTTLVDAVTQLNELVVVFDIHDARIAPHNNKNFNGWQVTPTFVSATQGPVVALDLNVLYTLANLLKTQYNLHLADANAVTDAHKAADATNTISAAAATSPTTLLTLVAELVSDYGSESLGHYNDSTQAAGGTYHRATLSGTAPRLLNRVYYPLISSSGYSASPYYGDATWGLMFGRYETMRVRLNDFKNKLNLHIADLNIHFSTDPTAPIPEIVTGSDITFASYNYAFVHSYSYTSRSATFEDVSAPIIVAAPEVISVDYQPMVITSIPVLANSGNTTHYDTSNIYIKIYRTTDGGSTYYYVGQVLNGTTTFTDRMGDEELATQETLYTTGGVVDNDAPPYAKAVHITNDGVAYYGNIYDGTDTLSRSLLQAIPGDIDSVPSDFLIEAPHDVVGVSSILSVPVVFCDRSIHRVEGRYDLQGQGVVSLVAISEVVGCVSENSIVQIDGGILFAGTDGFYHTDGYRLTPLSSHWKKTYQSITSTATKQRRIQGAYDTRTQRVWWTCTRTSTSSDNDSCVILDLNFGLQATAWSSASNYATISSDTYGHFAPAAITFYGGNLIRGHAKGYTFQHTDSATTDPYVNTAETETTWGTKTIRFDYQSLFTDMGYADRKWGVWIDIDLRNESNLDMAIMSNNDDLQSTRVLSPLAFRGHTAWTASSDGEDFGTPNNDSSYEGLIQAKRRFPANSLRFFQKQIRFTNNRISILDTGATATVSGAGNTATIDSGAWASDVVSYQIAFASDSYATYYEIIHRTSSTVVKISDPSNTLPTGSYAFKIRGYPKDQVPHLLSFQIKAVPFTDTRTATRSS